MRDFLQRLWSGGRQPPTGPKAEEIQTLSDQFRVTLRASARKIPETEASRDLLAHIHGLLGQDDWHWKDAYEVEQQIVLLYDQPTLQTELARRVLEARHVLYPDAAAWYRERLPEAATEEAQRTLLLRLVNDLQWRYTVNEAKLGYIKQITGRTGWIFIMAVLLFIGFLLLHFLGDAGKLGAWWKDSGRFMTLLLAAVSGYLGASFSMVAGLKTRLESSGLNQMKNASSRAFLTSRVLVGTGAAMILYFFFESDLLAGELFPKLAEAAEAAAAGGEGGAAETAAAGGETTGGGAVQRALLIVWCVIAGFSEKLVPGLLAKTEAQVADQAQTVTPGTDSQKAADRARAVAAGPAVPASAPAPAVEAAETATAEAVGEAGDAEADDGAARS